MPEKPIRPVYNSTRHEKADWNDVYRPVEMWMSSDDADMGNYSKALDEYSKLMCGTE